LVLFTKFAMSTGSFGLLAESHGAFVAKVC